jgi:hypothetical protein
VAPCGFGDNNTLDIGSGGGIHLSMLIYALEGKILQLRGETLRSLLATGLAALSTAHR